MAKANSKKQLYFKEGQKKGENEWSILHEVGGHGSTRGVGEWGR